MTGDTAQHEGRPAPAKAAKGLLARGFALVGFLYALWVASRAGRTASRILLAEQPSEEKYQVFWFQNTADGPIHDGFGLTYIGYTGAVWAIAQAIVLLACVALCFAGKPLLVRIGALGTVVCGSIWAGNFVNMMIVSDPLVLLPYTLAHTGLFACLCFFVWRRVSRVR